MNKNNEKLLVYQKHGSILSTTQQTGSDLFCKIMKNLRYVLNLPKYIIYKIVQIRQKIKLIKNY